MSTDNLGNENIDMAVGYSNGYKQGYEQGKKDSVKHGHWEESKCLDDCFWVCSYCKFPSQAVAAPKLYKYCPNCGARMDGKV